MRAGLVMIGPRWTTLTSESGEVRLADPEDFVRLEVETALRRDGVTVIPVLVAGARMPAADELPAGMRPLASRNAIELSDLRWRYDIGRLNARLDELLAGATGIHETIDDGDKRAAAPSSPRISPTVRLVIEGCGPRAASPSVSSLAYRRSRVRAFWNKVDSPEANGIEGGFRSTFSSGRSSA